jgi:hypothetical protein
MLSTAASASALASPDEATASRRIPSVSRAKRPTISTSSIISRK